tara:strand:- start:234 stop:1142 length:909 start_codon:yes stop_codon:yes gene_type:complete
MKRVLVIGDYLIDRYVLYQQERYDPANSQAPVVKLVSDCVVQGGAANFVRNLQDVVDSDTQIKFYYVDQPKLNDFPTKKRVFVEDKFVFREDTNDEVKRDEKLIDDFIANIQDNDYVVISDYHKGTINEFDIERIILKCNILSNVTSFVDTNFIKECHTGCTWLKVNTLTAEQYKPNVRKHYVIKDITNKLSCNTIITRGESGLVCLSKDGEAIRIVKDEDPTFIDSIGAGDACLVGLVKSVVDGRELKDTLLYADICGHLSTYSLGTLKTLDKNEVDSKFKRVKTTEDHHRSWLKWVFYSE